MFKPLYNIPQDWSIPSKNLRPLLDALKADMSKAEIAWDGSSEALKKFLVDNRIDPKTDTRYQHFFVSRRHTAATSYTWRGTNLYQMADRAELAENANDLVFIDVLVVNQFSISSSGQVITTTDLIYCNCKVWVFLDDDYLGRAWCLAECGQYTRPESKCVLVVYGKAEFKPGSDFLLEMKAGVAEDLPLIVSYILGKFKAKEAFNQAIDGAIVMLSPLSLLYQGRYAEAKIACEQEIRMLRDQQSEDSTALAKATVTMGKVLFRLGDLEAATEHLTSALEKCRESELELHGDIMNTFGIVLLAKGKHSEALTFYEKSLDLRVQCFGTEHVSVAQAHHNMGCVYGSLGDYEKARYHHDEALEIKLKCLGPDHVSSAETQNNIAIVLKKQGRLNEALEMYETALKTMIVALGHNHASLATTFICMGNCVYTMGRYQEARDYYSKGLEINKKCLGDQHTLTAEAKSGLAMVYGALGDNEAKLRLLEEVLDTQVQCLGIGHTSVAGTYTDMGNVYGSLGDLENALVHHHKALDICLRALGPGHVSVAKTKLNIGLDHLGLGNLAQAQSFFREAHDIILRNLGPDHPDTKKAARTLVICSLAKCCSGCCQCCVVS